MKFVKLSLLVLSIVFFAASCGNGSGDAKTTDTAAAVPVAAPALPPPAPADTVIAAPAKTDSTTSTIATDKKMEAKKK